MTFKVFKFLFVVICCNVFVNCSNSNKLNSKIYTDTLAISGFNSSRLVQNKNVADSNFLAFYETKTNQIKVTNLENFNCYILTPYMDKSKRLRSFYFQNLDTIILLYDDEIQLVNIKNKLIGFTKYKNEFLIGETPCIIDDYFVYSNIFYLSDKQSIIAMAHPYLSFWSYDFFKYPIEVEISLKDGSLKPLNNIKYPNQYQQNNYGNAFFFDRFFDGSSIYYSFQASDKILEYNTKTSNTSFYESKSSVEFLGEVEPFDTKFKEDMNIVTQHLVNNPTYLDIYKDTFKNVYYRFAYTAEKNKGLNAKYEDKELYLFILNNKFEVLDKVLIKDKVVYGSSFVTKQGFYIPKFNEKNTNITEFKVIDFTSL
jgi:hypothetical protein